MTEESQYDYWNERFDNSKKKMTTVNHDLIKVRLGDLKDTCAKRTVINQTRLLINFGLWCGEKKKKIDKLNKLDLIDYFETIEKQQPVTVSTTKQVIKSFLKEVNPKAAETIHPRKVSNNLTPDDLLTEQEITAMIKAAPNARDKALFACLYDGGMRKTELLSTKIKDASFDKYGCLMWLPVSKTSPRPARLVFAASYLREWLNVHPNKDKKESYIFCSLLEPHGQLSDNGLYEQIKRIAKKANISKKVTPHRWRSTRATDLSRKMSEQSLKNVMGWSPNSQVIKVYVKLSGSDIDDAMLSANGITKDEEDTEPSLLATERCPRCKELNDKSRDLCFKCGLPLSEKARKEAELSELHTEQRITDNVIEQLKKQGIIGNVEQKKDDRPYIDRLKKD
jgi:integrase/recombinase XerD